MKTLLTAALPVLAALAPVTAFAAPAAAPLEITSDEPIVAVVPKPQVDIVLTRLDTRPTYAMALQEAFLDKTVSDADTTVAQPVAATTSPEATPAPTPVTPAAR